MIKQGMFKIALAAALAVGAASIAVAQPDTDPRGGYRELGAGGVVTDGVNPVYHPEIFGNPAVARSFGFILSRDGAWHVIPNL